MAGSRGNERKLLSDLPDEVLLHILSFLPTKSLVATSLLSRRWKYLWTSTPNLQLHEYLFDDRNQFMNFAERALVLRAWSSLVSFSLACRVKEDESRINTWITSAIRYNVEQLSLFLLWDNDGHAFFLPSCVFGCQSLVKLELHMMRPTDMSLPSIIRVPSMICLPHLKHLELERVEFEDNESAEKLLSHPLLEELIISSCCWVNVSTVNVNSPKLQSLQIEDLDEDDRPEERQICFFGDNLKFFRYEGDIPPTQYCICGSTMQLREAEILISVINHEVQVNDVASKRYCKLINSLSRVQKLTLSDETAYSFNLLSRRLGPQTTIPVFERVTQLNLSAYDGAPTISIDSVWLRMMLKRYPHLEHLTFMEAVELDSLPGKLPLLRQISSCFRTHLKKITLLRYDPKCKEQADAIHLLLNSAPVLEEMVLHCKRDGCISGEDSMVAELEREFNTCPKVSVNCRVSIVLV